MTITKHLLGAGGSNPCGQSGYSSARRLALAVAAALLVSVVPAVAQDEAILVCGIPVQGHLAAGATDHYRPLVLANRQGVIDVIDTSGAIGLLRMGNPQFGETCSGSQFVATADYSAIPPLDISDCVGADAGDYTIELVNLQQGADNCGRPLTCGVAPSDARFDVPGEVDPYTFPGLDGQQVSFTAAMPGADHAIRLRLFDPDGGAVFDTCAGSNTTTLVGSGTYTLLVSACVAPLTGAYSVTWQAMPGCLAAPNGEFLYVPYLSPPGVAVIDAATSQTGSFVPLEPQFPRGQPAEFANSRIRITPNGAFAYVTFESASSIHIIDTATNRSVGAVSVPITTDTEDLLDVVFSPDATHAYVVSAPALGILAIGTATRRIEARIALPVDPEGFDMLTKSKLAVSPDGKTIYVATPGLARVFVVDVGSRMVTDTLLVTDPDGPDYYALGTPVALALRPDGGALFITYGGQTLIPPAPSHPGGFYVLDLASKTAGHAEIKGPLGGAPSDAVLSPDGRTAYVVADDVIVVDTTVPAIRTTISITDIVSNDAHGVALAPDGSRLYVTTNARDNVPAVLVIDPKAGQVVGTVKPFGTTPGGIAVTAPPTGLCVGDDQAQTRVTVGELVTAVNYAADGCPSAAMTVAPQSH